MSMADAGYLCECKAEFENASMLDSHYEGCAVHHAINLVSNGRRLLEALMAGELTDESKQQLQSLGVQISIIGDLTASLPPTQVPQIRPIGPPLSPSGTPIILLQGPQPNIVSTTLLDAVAALPETEVPQLRPVGPPLSPSGMRNILLQGPLPNIVTTTLLDAATALPDLEVPQLRPVGPPLSPSGMPIILLQGPQPNILTTTLLDAAAALPDPEV